MKNPAPLSFAAFVLPLVCSLNASSATVAHFQANGVTAYTTACANDCTTQVNLTLLQSKGAGQNLYYIYFDIYGHDGQSQVTDVNAVGPIPANMVSGDGRTDLTLDLDTEAAGLSVNYCVADAAGNFTCSPYSGGVLKISWKTTRQFSSSYSGQSQSKYANFTAHSNYHQEMSSATVTANILGTQFSDAGSQLGRGHDGGVLITKP